MRSEQRRFGGRIFYLLRLRSRVRASATLAQSWPGEARQHISMHESLGNISDGREDAVAVLIYTFASLLLSPGTG